MLQNILKLEGAQKLTKKEQKGIIGALKDNASFPCSCDGVYAGQCSTINCCLSLCGIAL